MVSELLGYAELAEVSGLSEAALRKRRSRGQLPEPDGPGPRWRRESLAAFLAEGAKVPAAVDAIHAAVPAAADHSAAPVARSEADPSPATPEPSTARAAAPVASSTPAPSPDAEDRRRRSVTIEQVLACPHPDDDRKQTRYMVMCLRCGRRQTGRDAWTGAGYAGWDESKLDACPHPEDERLQRSWGTACGVCGRLVR